MSICRGVWKDPAVQGPFSQENWTFGFSFKGCGSLVNEQRNNCHLLEQSPIQTFHSRLGLQGGESTNKHDPHRLQTQQRPSRLPQNRTKAAEKPTWTHRVYLRPSSRIHISYPQVLSVGVGRQLELPEFVESVFELTGLR